MIGGSVALAGHGLLELLITVGWAAGIANAVQAVTTLQLNFVANGRLTWRRRVAGSGVGLWRRWGRFHVARGGSLLLCIALFPVVAPSTGTSVAYWSLLVVGGVVNFCSDKYWSFSAGSRSGPRHAAGRSVTSRRLRRLLLGAVLAGLSAVLFTDGFILVVSVFMVVVAATTLAFQLYKWWRPEHNDPHRYGEPDAPRLPGVILVPMRHEEAVAGQTLERLARLDHPDYWVVPIIDHPDDPATAAIAHGKARKHPDRVLVCPYPEETDVHNKPIGLNAAVDMLHELQIPYAWVGVADAEDLFHPDLLKLVDYRFRTTGAGIVQCGVQLMNFASDPQPLPLPMPPPPGRACRGWPRCSGSSCPASRMASAEARPATCSPRPGTTVDRQQPLRAGYGPPACRGRRRSSDRSVDSSSVNPRWVISNTARASTRNSDAAWAICSSSWALRWVLRTSRSVP